MKEVKSNTYSISGPQWRRIPSYQKSILDTLEAECSSIFVENKIKNPMKKYTRKVDIDNVNAAMINITLIYSLI